MSGSANPELTPFVTGSGSPITNMKKSMVGARRRESDRLSKIKEIESRVEISHLPFNMAFGALTGAIGFQWGQRHLSVAGTEEELLAPARAQNLAAFAFAEL